MVLATKTRPDKCICPECGKEMNCYQHLCPHCNERVAVPIEKLKVKKMEKIWVECTCDYEGYAEMIKPDGWEYQHPFCPECGELIDNAIELSQDEWKNKTTRK